jgi:hypothetical protein
MGITGPGRGLALVLVLFVHYSAAYWRHHAHGGPRTQSC